MKNEKKGLLLTALAALFGMALLNGCDSEEGSAEKTVTSFKAVKVGGEEKIDRFVMSKDGKHIYATVKTNAELYGAEAGKAGDTAKITKIPLTGFAAGAVAPGKADLTGASRVDYISATKEGALVSVSHAAAAPNGAFYVAGSTLKAAWVSQAGHAGRDLAQVADAGHGNDRGIFVDDNTHVLALVASNAAGKEFPIVFDNTNPHAVGQSVTGVALDSAPAKLGIRNNTQAAGLVGRDHANGEAFPLGMMVSTADNTFVFDDRGVKVVPAASVGIAIAPAAPAPADVAAAPAANGTVGIRQFNLSGEATAVGAPAVHDQQGDIVLFLDGNKIYVGFTTTTTKNGGVGVYEIGKGGVPPTIHRPAAGGVGVIGFVKQGKNVLAVTKTGLLITKIDASKKTVAIADKYLDSLKDSETVTYKKDNFPTDNIIGAGVDKSGNLIIATDNKGLIVGSTKKAAEEASSSSSSSSDSSSK